MVRNGFSSIISVLLCCFLLLLPFTANAHPGRTDSNGGHTCRTNCEKWGLKYGEYHYHNGGGSASNGGSSSTSKSAPSSPVPKVDENQVKADKYYTAAMDLYNRADYQKAITELEKIYELDKGNSKTENLIQKSMSNIYELANSKANEEDYSTAKVYAVYIKENQHSSAEIKQKAKGLLAQIGENEKINELLNKATIARDKKNYVEAFGFIQEAQKVKELDRTKSLYNETVEVLASDAEEAFHKKKYGDAEKFYKLLVENTEMPTLISQYQKKLQRIQVEQLLNKSFDIDTADFEGTSLFNHLMKEENNTSYNENIINILKNSLQEDDSMNYIFSVNIKELFKGGDKDAS